MTSEQARKLLGGYATNSLSEAERKALLEAALDDQELFDALQQEQALKELLADPVSRGQIRSALSEKRESAAWWSRRWAWGGFAAAVAAAVLVVAVVRTSQPQKIEMTQVQPAVKEPAPAAPPPPAAAPAKRTVRRAEPRLASAPARAKDEAATQAPQPQAAASAAPPPPPQAVPAPSEEARKSPQDKLQVQAERAQVQTAQEQAPQPAFRASTARRDAAPSAGVTGGFLANYQGPLLRYSIVRRESSGGYSPLPPGATLRAGDAVRIVAYPGAAGYLSLEQFDAGQWKKLLPQPEQGGNALANTSQTLPEAPIIVKDSEQRFRLMLSQPAGSPLVIEIAIAPGKTP